MTETRRRLGGREATSARIDGDFALAVGKPDRPLPEGWKWRLLTDLARLESGHTPSRRRPDFWGGYRLRPDAVELWQGRPDRLHDREHFLRQDDGSWRAERLSP